MDEEIRKYRTIEEQYFADYLEELQGAGYVKEWSYESKTFPLFSPVKLYASTKIKTLTRVATYTPDFVIKWTKEGINLFATRIRYDDWYRQTDDLTVEPPRFVTDDDKIKPFYCTLLGNTYVDVKGTFNINNSDIEFPIKQKIMLHMYKVYVQKIRPMSYTKRSRKYKGIFEKTFTPSTLIHKVHKTTGKPLKQKWDYRTLEEYISKQSKTKKQ